MIFTQIIGMSSGTSFCGKLVRVTNSHVCMYHINSFREKHGNKSI
jgi:hypothetical protein